MREQDAFEQELAEIEAQPREEEKEFKLKPDYEIDLNNLPTQDHIWIDRGTHFSCEGAPHANHRAYKRQK